jgi:hypothetical protein
MNGSTVAQQIYANFIQAAQQALGQVVGPVLTAEAAIVAAAIGLQVVIQGTALATGTANLSTVIRKIVTGIIISALVGQAVFNQFVGTNLTQTIPNQIAQMVSGGQNGQTIARAFDGLLNFLSSQGTQIRAQLTGISGIPYVIAEWLIEAVAKIFLILSFLVWGIAASAMFITIPIIAALLWTWIFDATRAWGERSVGFAGGLLLVQMVVLMLSSFIVHAEATFLQQVGHTVPMAGAAGDFSMNAGDVAFTGFNEANPGLGGGGGNNTTINPAESVGAMINALLVAAFGFFLLGVSGRIAWGIAATSGFSAAPVTNVVYTVMTAPARMFRR